MKPVNTKSMFAMLCNTMEKLDAEEINANHAIAMSKLSDSAVRLFLVEFRRAELMSNPEIKGEYRNIEQKNFDSLPG